MRNRPAFADRERQLWVLPVAAGLMSALPRGNYERPQPVPCIRKMCCKALPRLHRARKIVMPFFDLWRIMREQPRDQNNLLRCVHRQKGRCRSTEVMKTHCLSNNT